MGELADHERFAIAEGRSFVQSPDESNLEDDPRTWERLWMRHREEILADFAEKFPGEKPRAWWKFEERIKRT
jgi:hypothetical protein